MSTTQWQTRRIGVYRDDPVWDKHARWFNVPIADLDRLWIAEYELSGDADESDVERAATEIRKDHPTAVLVY